MALRQMHSMAHSDDELYDLAKGTSPDYEPPEYPGGLCMTLAAADLAEAGYAAGEPGDTCRFSAMGEVTSIFQSADACQIELQIGEFAGEDGKFFDLTQPGYICLCGPQCEKMDLDTDCERGDTLHLIGTARIESCSSNEYAGETCSLQITELTFENESDESRVG